MWYDPSVAFARWDPIRDLLAIHQRLDRYAPSQAGWAPPVDLHETRDEYVVTAEVPGLSNRDVDVRYEDGRLTIVDRVKDMIISGGENVYCAEVERVLHEHPSVLEAAVVGLPDPTWGERVAAVVVPRPGAALQPSEVVAFTRERLAHYKCPREVFVREALPRNPMGKVQKFRVVEELVP